MQLINKEKLDEIVSRLVAEFSPEKVILFGSHAWGIPHSDSETLTPYATAYRYPVELFEDEPDEEQMNEALELAEQIFNFVLLKLPKDVHP